jgi:spermidine synthase
MESDLGFAPARLAAGEAESRPASARGTLILACALFVLSGACALAYQVLWTRYLGLFLGNTVLLHMAVLGAFMGGLALGSFLLGRRADGVGNPLRMYGFLEIGLACYAMLFPTLANLAQDGVLAAAGTFPTGSFGLLAVKIAVAAGLLILPTVLMGATFPALTAHLQRRVQLGATGANWLYFANCAGAVAGVLLAGFWLIPTLGLQATSMAVAMFNLAVGGAAVIASRAGTEGEAAAPQAAIEISEAPPVTRAQRQAVLIAICLSGATAFIYELVWTRMFAVTLGSSTYSFTLMLAAFISGLALGCIAAGWRPLRRAPLAAFAGAEVLIGLAIAISIPLYQRMPYLFWQARWLLRPVEDSMWVNLLLQYGLTFLVMAGPTFLFGLTFPLAIRAATGRDDEIAGDAASVYGWNTLGTLMGVTAAGCLLIPLLGLRGTLMVGAFLNILIGGFLVLRAGIAGPQRLAIGAAAAAAAVILLASPRWHPMSFARGSFRQQSRPPSSWAEYEKYVLTGDAVFYKEDFGTTVAVLDGEGPHGQQRVLVVDGKIDASSYGDQTSQILVGQLPMLFKPEAKDVFLLGLGSGVTAGSILTHPVQRVDCAELSPAVAAASRHFNEISGRPTADPRFHMVIDDGKTALAASPRQYDVIVSEPTNPWISGVGNLFSEEFFHAAAGKLKPGGIIAQWFHSYEFDDRLVATTLRTFRTVFPHTLVFQTASRDHVIIASKEPIRPAFEAMEARLREARVARDLTRIGAGRLSTILAMQTHSSERAAALADGGGINSDDLPLLEHLAPYALYTRAFAQKIMDSDGRMTRDPGLLLNEYRASRPLRQEDYAAMIDFVADPRVAHGRLEYRLLRDYLKRWPDDPRYLKRMAQLLDKAGRPEDALPFALRAATAGDAQAKTQAEALRKRAAASEQAVF